MVHKIIFTFILRVMLFVSDFDYPTLLLLEVCLVQLYKLKIRAVIEKTWLERYLIVHMNDLYRYNIWSAKWKARYLLYRNVRFCMCVIEVTTDIDGWNSSCHLWNAVPSGSKGNSRLNRMIHLRHIVELSGKYSQVHRVVVIPIQATKAKLYVFCAC